MSGSGLIPIAVDDHNGHRRHVFDRLHGAVVIIHQERQWILKRPTDNRAGDYLLDESPVTRESAVQDKCLHLVPAGRVCNCVHGNCAPKALAEHNNIVLFCARQGQEERFESCLCVEMHTPYDRSALRLAVPAVIKDERGCNPRRSSRGRRSRAC